MGFFPNIFKIPKADIIPNIITLGGYGVTKGSLVEASKVVKSVIPSLIGPIAGHPAAQQQRIVAPPIVNMPAGPAGYGPQPAYNISYGAPQYGGGGSYDAWNYQPQQPQGGQQSWAYSTQYSIPQSQPYPASSEGGGRIWEDLAPFLPLFL